MGHVARNARLLGVALAAALSVAVPASLASDQAFNGDVQLIEHWNGAAWKVTRAKGAPADADLAAVTGVSAHDVWAVGSYVYDDPTDRPYAEHFNGASWKPFLLPVPNPNGDYPDAWLGAVSASSASNVWAVGRGTQRAMIEHFNGQRWELSGAVRPDGSELLGVAAVARRDVWAVGWTPARNWDSRPLIEHWTGSGWRLVASPHPRGNDELLAISARSASDVWAVGDSQIPGLNQYHALVVHWNGRRWSRVDCPIPFGGGTLEAVAAISADDVWAVGSYENRGAPLIEHWDGHSWHIVRGPRSVVGDLTAVSAVSSTDVWAVGWRKGAKTLAEHWDGHSWTLVATGPRTRDEFYGIAAVSSKDFWAVGGSGAPY